MKASLNFTTAMVLSVLVAACDPYNSDEYREYAVVESHFITDRELPVVLLTTTISVDLEYSFHESAVDGAEVTINLLNENDTIEQSFVYVMDFPGVYRPTAQEQHRVLPRRTYALEAEIPGHGLLRARTTVPDDFQVVSEVPESVVYQQDTLRVDITQSMNPGRQNVYILNTFASDPVDENLTSGYRALLDEDENLENYRNYPSPLINEEVFPVVDGTIRIQYPWIGAVFYGENRIIINSLDRNISDFIRSQDVQLGGSTLSPGEIPNAIYHIDGGIGVFGSIATDTIVTYILPNDP